jgi:hypothetical protein
MGRIAGRFPRVEPRRRARAFLEGLLAGLSRVNCWSIAEQVGDASPDGMQHLLARASWDQNGVAGTCGSTWSSIWEPMTGCWWSMRPGTSRRAPRRWGCSVSTPARRAAPRTARSPSTWSTPRNGITRSSTGRLYLPRSWTDDPARCPAAGVPDDTEFATKPALAQQMIAAALDAGTPCWWVAGDEVYGNAPKLRPPRRARYRVRARGGQGPPDHHRHRHAQGRLTAAEAVLAAAQRRTRPPKASGCTTGPGSRPPTPRWPAPRASASCWSGAPSAPASWRSIAPTHHGRPSWPHWWESPAAVGRSKKRSSPARSSPPWTNTRSAPGPPGAAGRCWPCSLTPSHCDGCHRADATYKRRADRIDPQRDPAPLQRTDSTPPPSRRRDPAPAALVTMATPTSGSSPRLPLRRQEAQLT